MEQSSRVSIFNYIITGINVLILILLIVLVWQTHDLNKSQLEVTKSQIVQMQANAVWENTSRYLEKWSIMVKDRGLVADNRLSSDEYWLSYWFFQQEQYYVWKDGMINNNIFQIWMSFRRSEWKANETLAGISYRDAYQSAVKTGLLTKEFQDYMNGVFSQTE